MNFRTDGPVKSVPRGLANVCLSHAMKGGARAAALRNERDPSPRCVCRVANGERLRIEAVHQAADDLDEIAKRLRAVAA